MVTKDDCEKSMDTHEIINDYKNLQNGKVILEEYGSINHNLNSYTNRQIISQKKKLHPP